MSVVLQATGLEAEGREGRIFGPLDLTLHEGEVCLVHGEQGSGKSSLLLALVGRLRESHGTLLIDGIDAMANPREAMARTTVARIGDYVVPEDRLTLRESIYERCFIDGIPVANGAKRMDQLERLLGFRFDRSMEMAQFTPLERTVASVLLALLRPARVVVLDDADVLVPHEQLGLMFELLRRVLALDGAVLVATTLNDEIPGPGIVELALPPKPRRATTPIEDEAVRVTRGDDTPAVLDRDVLYDAVRHAAPLPSGDDDDDEEPET